MTMSNRPISENVNPAGQPQVRITQPERAEPYTRETFMRDLGKVAAKRDPKK